MTVHRTPLQDIRYLIERKRLMMKPRRRAKPRKLAPEEMQRRRDERLALGLPANPQKLKIPRAAMSTRKCKVTLPKFNLPD